MSTNFILNVDSRHHTPSHPTQGHLKKKDVFVYMGGG